MEFEEVAIFSCNFAASDLEKITYDVDVIFLHVFLSAFHLSGDFSMADVNASRSLHSLFLVH